jgi:hypothetical protein
LSARLTQEPISFTPAVDLNVLNGLFEPRRREGFGRRK